MILGTAAYMTPGAGARQGGRQARRHLGVRRRAVRDADRQTPLRRRDRLRHARGGAAARDPVRRICRPRRPPSVRDLLRSLPRSAIRKTACATSARRGSRSNEAPSSPRDAERRPSGRFRGGEAPLAWAAAAAMAVVAAFLAWKWLSSPAIPRPPVTAFAVTLPEGSAFPFGLAGSDAFPGRENARVRRRRFPGTAALPPVDGIAWRFRRSTAPTARTTR